MKAFLVVISGLLMTACADMRTAEGPRSGTVGTVQTAPQTSAEVRGTQQRLTALGFYDGPIDGVWGQDTRAAVERYQQSRGLAMTGRIDEPTRAALRAPPPRPVTLSDATDVRTVQNRLRQLNYYNGPADGVWGTSTQAAMENFQRSRGLPIGQTDTATLSAMGLDPAAFPARNRATAVIREPLEPSVVRGMQQRLRQHGYYRGRIDGIWGPNTERGLAQFQRSRGIEPNGQLTPMTASALGMDPNNLSLTAVPR